MFLCAIFLDKLFSINFLGTWLITLAVIALVIFASYKIFNILFKSEIYLIKWLPYSNTKFHGHNGKQCDYMLIKGNYLNEIRLEDKNLQKTFYKIRWRIKSYLIGYFCHG